MSKKVIVIPDNSTKIIALFAAIAFLIGSGFFTYVAVKDLFESQSQ